MLKIMMLKNITFSKMTTFDLQSIAPILVSEFDDFWNLDVLKSELESPSSYYFVIKNNEEIVGFAGIKVILDEADIMDIVIKKSYRGNGLGKLLMEYLISFARSLKLLSLTLEVREDNYSAIALYTKLGFIKVGLRKNYYDGKNAILMNLPLISEEKK